ncbi:rhomboid family intramembrane serine protease [Sphingobacterium luzhongxinii]|nr:rhomboid family intramembrane serine protease [Sphingobacterium sp. xlx-183]
MSLFDIFPTFAEAPYSYIVVPIMLVSSVIGFYHKPYFHALLLHPYEVYRGKRLHTLLTSAFVHRNWLHLINNLLIIYGLGYDMFGNIDQEYGLFAAYVWSPILWFALIVLPNVVQTLSKKDDFIFTAVGASGLSFGLYGFSALFFPLQKMGNFILPFVTNMFHNWLFGLVIVFLLSVLNRNRIVNSRLHLSAYFIGGILGFFVRPSAVVEIIDFIFSQ